MKEQSQIAYAGREAGAEAVGAKPGCFSPGDTPEQDVYRAVRCGPVNSNLSYQTVIVRVPVQGPTIKRVVE